MTNEESGQGDNNLEDLHHDLYTNAQDVDLLQSAAVVHGLLDQIDNKVDLVRDAVDGEETLTDEDLYPLYKLHEFAAELAVLGARCRVPRFAVDDHPCDVGAIDMLVGLVDDVVDLACRVAKHCSDTCECAIERADTLIIGIGCNRWERDVVVDEGDVDVYVDVVDGVVDPDGTRIVRDDDHNDNAAKHAARSVFMAAAFRFCSHRKLLSLIHI
eukprot:3185379-Amphidinium_carterae.1